MSPKAITAAGMLFVSLTASWVDTSRTAHFSLGPTAAFAQQKSVAQMEAEFDKESNPKRRVSLASEITDQRLKQMLATYDTNDVAKETEGMELFLASIARLEKVLDALPKPDAAKSAELRLRRQMKDLTNLRMAVSFEEQQAVKKALERITELHERILYRIMSPKKKK